ncbi:hypothetical protein evm_006218 [Chilo suppressalis]|nr:hypothetical protein evm_006218 [Chilo suppressalis]
MAATGLKFTVAHRRLRLQFAHEHSEWTLDQWGHVLFSDETRVCLYGSDQRRRVYRVAPENVMLRAASKKLLHYGGGFVMVWGAGFHRYKSNAQSRGLIADLYIADILENVVVPYSGYIEDDMLLMHDNARPHTARIVTPDLRDLQGYYKAVVNDDSNTVLYKRCEEATFRLMGITGMADKTAAPAIFASKLHRNVTSECRNTNFSCRVVLEKDAWLPLYRSWSLEAALGHAPALAPHLRLHSHAGAARLRQLLADMGFPLQQARQAYRSMDVELRRSLLPSLEASTDKHKLPVPTRAAFLLQRPHAPPLAAHDLVYAILALIEHESIPKGEGFQLALDALESEGGLSEGARIGLEAAKQALGAVARAAHDTLAARRLHLAGPFSYFIVQEGGSGAGWLRCAGWVGVLARWVSAGTGGARPVLACTSLTPTHCLLLGVPPRPHQEPRNLFGAAFEQAATKSGVTVSLDHLDSSIITLPTAQRAQFLDALTALLA